MNTDTSIVNSKNDLLKKTDAAKYLQVSERTLRWYKSEYNKVNADDPIELEGHSYRKSDLDKLKAFSESRKKAKRVQINENNSDASKSIATKTSTLIKAEELKIDEGFKTLIRPLAEQEFNQLEESILQDGILNPVIVTSDYVVIDGHHRYSIAQKHNLPIPIKIMEFNSRNDIELWIIKNQFARRNLSKYERGLLALRLKPIIAMKAKQKQIESGGAVPQKSTKPPIETRKEIAEIAGISHDTIAKIELIDNKATNEIKQLVIDKKMSINKAYKLIKNIDPKHKSLLPNNTKNFLPCSFFDDPDYLLSLCQFLLDNEKEVMDILALQWTINDAKTAWQEEAREEGINIGKLQNSEEIAIKMLHKYKTFDEIHEFTNLSIQRIKELANTQDL